MKGMLCDRVQAVMAILSPQTTPVRYKCVCVHATSLLPVLLLPGISSGHAPAAFIPRVTCELWATWRSCSSLRWQKGEWGPATFSNLAFEFSHWDRHAEILHTCPLRSSSHFAEERFGLPETVPTPREPFL